MRMDEIRILLMKYDDLLEMGNFQISRKCHGKLREREREILRLEVKAPTCGTLVACIGPGRGPLFGPLDLKYYFGLHLLGSSGLLS